MLQLSFTDVVSMLNLQSIPRFKFFVSPVGELVVSHPRRSIRFPLLDLLVGFLPLAEAASELDTVLVVLVVGSGPLQELEFILSHGGLISHVGVLVHVGSTFVGPFYFRSGERCGQSEA